MTGQMMSPESSFRRPAPRSFREVVDLRDAPLPVDVRVTCDGDDMTVTTLGMGLNVTEDQCEPGEWERLRKRAGR